MNLPSLSADSLFSAVLLLSLMIAVVGLIIVAGVVVARVVTVVVILFLLRFGNRVENDGTEVVGLALLGRDVVIVAEGLLDFRAVVDLTSKTVSSLFWNTICSCLCDSLKVCGA